MTACVDAWVEAHDLAHTRVVGVCAFCHAKILDFSSRNVHKLVHTRVTGPVPYSD